MNLHDRDLQRATRKEALAEGMQRGLKRGIAQGHAEGELNARIESARVMLNDGMDIAKVAKYVGLTVEEISTEILQESKTL